jgi:predicted metal-dependent phosphoesterase TrpH
MSAVARLDLHAHTRHSNDCFVPLEELVQLAAARGVTHLAVTDHDSCECARQNSEKSWPLELIFGEEVTLSDSTHLIALGISKEIRSKNLDDALCEMRDAGALIIVPHPFKRKTGIFSRPDSEIERAKKLVAERADAIEVWNSKLTDAENQRAFALARELGKLAVAGSDAHFGHDVGDAVLEISCETAKNWRELLQNPQNPRVLVNKFARAKGFDEHLVDDRVSNLLPRVRKFVPKSVRMAMKHALHRALYQPRVRARGFALEEVRFEMERVGHLE